MHRIDTATAVAVIPAPAAVGGTVGFFVDEDILGGVTGTQVSADWANAVQEELRAVVVAAAITLDKTARDQLLTAIQHLIKGTTAAAGNNLADVTTTPYLLVTTKKNVPFDTSGGAKTCTLPTSTDVPGEEWLVGVRTGGSSVTFTGTISGEVNPSIDSAGTFRRVKSLGTGGWIWA